MKYVNEIWEDCLSIVSQEKWYLDTISKYLVPAITKTANDKILYGAGNWSPYSHFGHDVIEFSLEDLPVIIKSFADMETYFFPKSLGWILCITHESFSFVAGTHNFIDQIRLSFSNHKEYQPNYNQLEP